jgi:cytochrome P450
MRIGNVEPEQLRKLLKMWGVGGFLTPEEFQRAREDVNKLMDMLPYGGPDAELSELWSQLSSWLLKAFCEAMNVETPTDEKATQGALISITNTFVIGLVFGWTLREEAGQPLHDIVEAIVERFRDGEDISTDILTLSAAVSAEKEPADVSN